MVYNHETRKLFGMKQENKNVFVYTRASMNTVTRYNEISDICILVITSTSHQGARISWWMNGLRE